MDDDRSLEGKVGLVTGASSGIGRATARYLAEQGVDVVLAARSIDKLETIAESIESECPATAHPVETDVADDEQVASMVSATIDTFGQLDIVVNNAGINVLEDVEFTSTEQYRDIMSVNVDGMFFTARESIPHLRETDGNLVFMGSFAGQYPRPHQPLYTATKWWTRGFALSLAGSLGQDGVAVTVINPTEVLTNIETADGRPGKEVFDQERAATPEEVAEAIGFIVRQEPPMTVNELDLYSRDKFGEFAPPRSE